MAKTINALYEDGVFKPLRKLRLKNKQKVKLTVVESEKSSKHFPKTTVNRRSRSTQNDVTAHPAYRIVALFKSGVHDLSARHDHYLYR